MKTDTKTKLIIILRVLIIISIAMAWGHSLVPFTESQEESGFFLELLRPAFRIFLPEEMITDHLLRKMAHFSEYALMGFLMTAYLELSKGIERRRMINVLFSGLTVALMDETIQIFSGRGPRISDVWLDLAGFTIGGFIACIAVYLIRKRRRRSS